MLIQTLKTIIAPTLPIYTPSFPRKRESRRSQSSPLREIKYKSPPADPFSFYGFRRVGFLSESGFSGFCQLVFDLQALIRIRLDWIYGYSEKRKPGEAKS